MGNLTRGATKSCGCLSKELSTGNLTGQVFGRLIALYPTNKRVHGSIVWHCVCDCGSETDVPSSDLKSRNTRSCGCMVTGNKDITGQRFGKLVAMYPTEKRVRGSIVWHCQCDCGAEKDVPRSFLISGSTHSCGCIPNRGKDITNQRFGKLVAVCPTEERQNDSVVWHCKCDCGGVKDVPLICLINGNTKSCVF